MFDLATVGIGLEQDLNPFEGLPIEDTLLFTLEPFAAMRPMRFVISDAARRENVISKIRRGSAPWTIRCATR